MARSRPIVGTPKQYAPPSGVGTVTIGPGEWIVFLIVHASAANATVSILGGPAIQVPITGSGAPTTIPFPHELMQRNASNTGQIVFTNTDQAYVHTVKP